MKRLRRSCLALLILTPCAGFAAATPVATAQDLCDALVSAMKNGRELGYEGRLKALDPRLRADLDLALMTRLIVGPAWRSLAEPQRENLVSAFSNYSIAVYASRFKAWSGEAFLVEPKATELASGDVVVHTRLIPKDAEAVQLDYLLRKEAAGWRIIDVFLSGTISELATRRSEYSAVLRTGGAEGLTQLLRQKTADIAKG